MQSYNKTVKSKTVPVFITICGIAIIGSAILGVRSSFSANVDNKPATKEEVVKVDEVNVNKKLNELQAAVNYSLDGERTVSNGVGNVLKFDAEKIRFAFMVIAQEGNNNRIKRNVSPEGNGVTGYVAIDEGYYIDYYQELFNAGVNEELLKQIFVEKDGYIYGSIMNGILMSTETYKVNKVTKNGDNYEVLIDVLVIDYDDETSIEYIDEDVTEYPESLVAYQIKLNVTKSEQIYTINSMVA